MNILVSPKHARYQADINTRAIEGLNENLDGKSNNSVKQKPLSCVWIGVIFINGAEDEIRLR